MMFLRAALAALLLPSLAFALNGGTNISVQNGTIAITGTVAVGNGGTGVSSWSANNSVVISGTSGTGAVQLVSGGTSGNVLKSAGAGVAPTFGTIDLSSSNAVGASVLAVANGGSGATTADFSTPNKCVRFNGTKFVPASGDCATAQTPLVAFGSGQPLTTSQVIFLGAAGQVDATENTAQSIMPAASFTNLRCFNPAIQGVGNDITIAMQKGTCGSAGSGTGMPACTLTGGASVASPCTDVATTGTTTANQCVTLKVTTPASLTANAFITCVVERTA